MRSPILPTAAATMAALCAMTCAFGPTAAEPASPSSVYTKVNDPASCTYKNSEGDDSGPTSCEYLCDGPVAGVKTRLLSCGDWDHLYIQIDGAWRSTWKAMTAVGRMAGIGNKNGVIEWVFDGGKLTSRQQLQGLVVRFNGTNDNNQPRQALAVFGLQKGEVCWKGNFNSNEAARAAVHDAACIEKLEAEK